MFISFFSTILAFCAGKICQVYIYEIERDDIELVTIKNIYKYGFSLQQEGKKFFSIQKNGKYLSVTQDGYITYKEKARGWELFRLFDVGYTLPSIPLFKEGISIPKVVNQTNNELVLNRKYKSNVDSILERNNDWQYKYWSEKSRIDFIYDVYGWDVLNIYLSINRLYGAARADFFRYLLMYKMGGLYLDIKSGAKKQLTPLIEDKKYIVCQWSQDNDNYKDWGRWARNIPGGEYQQWILCCVSGHPVMRNVVLQVMFNILTYDFELHGHGKGAVLNVTGPIAYTKVVCDLKSNYNITFEDVDKAGLVYDVFNERKGSSHYWYQTLPLIV